MSHTAPWRTEHLEPVGVPTMISRAEQRYLQWLGKHYWNGRGDVVEIGPWLGGSTICLARGMAASEHVAAGRLQVFDNFVWRAFMSERAPLDLLPGATFLPQFTRNLAPHAATVQATVAQLPDDHPEGDTFATDSRGDDGSTVDTLLRWPGEPIEILFVDGAKSWTAIRHLLAETGPALQPGHSLIVCQDYSYWGGYWVPMAMSALTQHVEPIHRVAPGGTVTYRVTSTITRESVETLPDFASLSVEQGLAWLSDAEESMHAQQWTVAGWAVAVARVRFLMHRGETEAATAALTSLCDVWPLLVPVTELEGARRWLAETTRAPVAEVRHRRFRRVVRRALATRA